MKKFTNKELNKMLKPSKPITYWKRYGKCKGCGACCRIICGHGYTSMYHYYLLAEKINGKNYTKVDCKYLTLNGKCSIWFKKKKFPSVCRKFPMDPKDGVYKIVKDFCGFKFKKVKK